MTGTAALTAKANSTQIKANLLSNIYAINAFLDLVRQGAEKKIIFISSPSGDVEFTRVTANPAVVGYSVSKAGMNMVMTKFGAELAQEGIKTLSLSPGWVDTDAGEYTCTKTSCVGHGSLTCGTAKAVTGDPDVRRIVLGAFRKLDQGVNGPIPIAESVTDQLQKIQNLTEADSGKFVTHRANGGWF